MRQSSVSAVMDNGVIQDENFRISNLVNGTLALKSFLWAIHCDARILIIKQLVESPKSVKSLSHNLDELHSVISFHLRHLRNNQIVDFTQDGKERIYRLSDSFLKIADPIMELDKLMNYKILRRRNS